MLRFPIIFCLNFGSKLSLKIRMPFQIAAPCYLPEHFSIASSVGEYPILNVLQPDNTRSGFCIRCGGKESKLVI